MKKNNLLILTCIINILQGVNSFHAQENHVQKQKTLPCQTNVPLPQWNSWFNKEVENYKQQKYSKNEELLSTYTIPIIVHVIHGGEPVGTYPNITSGQINSQIPVLNADFSGTGLNSLTYPATAFQAFAADPANAVSASSKDGSGRIAIANTGIQFCLTTKDVNGNSMIDPGIERINWATIPGAYDPSAISEPEDWRDFIDSIIKPATIWDPKRYLNIWLVPIDVSAGGYATFPSGTGLSGLMLGSWVGTDRTDGIVTTPNAFGSINLYPSGNYFPLFKHGRLCDHEVGHWLGLRHVDGDPDTICGADDYCKDTPIASTIVGNCTSYPLNPNICTLGGTTSPNGDMFMNFMTYTNDDCMYMFTMDQTSRMQTAMSVCPNRKFLGTHGLCNSTSATINSYSIQNEIKIFPNPNNGIFTFAVSFGHNSNITYSITNNIGQQIYTASIKNITTANINVDLSLHKSGIYYVNLINDKGEIASSKFVIK